MAPSVDLVPVILIRTVGRTGNRDTEGVTVAFGVDLQIVQSSLKLLFIGTPH